MHENMENKAFRLAYISKSSSYTLLSFIINSYIDTRVLIFQQTLAFISSWWKQAVDKTLQVFTADETLQVA